MGNPNLRRTDDEPPLGIRHCSLCRWCDQLVWRDGLLRAHCEPLAMRYEPQNGCARFTFDPATLGEDGSTDTAQQ